MKPISRITAALMAAVLSTAAFGCENKKSSDNNSETETTSAAQNETTTAEETENETTAAPSDAEATSSTESAVTSTTTMQTTTQTTTAQAPENNETAPVKGYESSFEAAKAYYNAYITGDADAVYDMFCSEEIEGYNAYINTTELLEGKNPQVVFKRSNVTEAIKKSMGAIYGIMVEKSDVPHEKWSVSLAEDSVKNIDENELKDFNKTLGTNFTSAADCGHIYYKDGNDEHSFVGNACALVQLDGRWYLSYSTVLKAELITYMDIF